MKTSVNQKRRRLLKLGGVAAILPVAGGGTGNHAAIRSAQASETGTFPTTDPLSASAQAASPLLSADQALLFQYDQPAVESSIQFQGLPVGNGRLGALAGGASEREALYLNEITLWSGSKDVVDLSIRQPAWAPTCR